MKAVPAIIGWMLFVAVVNTTGYVVGYWQGARVGKGNAMAACVRDMTPICTAVSLSYMRQAERLLLAKAKAQRPVVVECPR